MAEGSSAEIERIRRAYEERDAAPVAAGSSWASPGYRLYLQDLEWSLLSVLAATRQLPQGRAVLEVGCGSGYFLDRFHNYGASRVAGVELMEARVAQAAERNPLLEVRAGDASDLPYADGEFDLVTQFTCLSSVLDAGLRAAIAAEMWRVTRPGGAIVSYDMVPTPLPLRLLARYGRWRARRAGADEPAGTPTTPITADEVRRLFPEGDHHHRRAGLRADLAVIARWGRPLGLLAAAPPLRTHLLAIVVKPGRA